MGDVPRTHFEALRAASLGSLVIAVLALSAYRRSAELSPLSQNIEMLRILDILPKKGSG